MDIVFLGLSITSSWGNGHATTYRGLLRELTRQGHRVTFLERDVPWYAPHRDLPEPPFAQTLLYGSLAELRERFSTRIGEADAVIVGSYVPEGQAVGDWVLDTARGVTAFYDIDTPVTLAHLAAGTEDYLAKRQIRDYDLYLSFTGGPTLRRLEREFGARCARAFYCAFDTAAYFPQGTASRWDLGYLGTYSEDRQPRVDSMLVGPARRWKDGRFTVAGPMYPSTLVWPPNVTAPITYRLTSVVRCITRSALPLTSRGTTCVARGGPQACGSSRPQRAVCPRSRTPGRAWTPSSR